MQKFCDILGGLLSFAFLRIHIHQLFENNLAKKNMYFHLKKHVSSYCLLLYAALLYFLVVQW